jgi:hypothetical protein
MGYTMVIAVEDAFGNQTQYQANFTPTSSGPSVTNFNPTFGPTGTSVTITGTGFDSGTPSNNVVSFGGQVATSFTVNSSAQITATVPTGAPVGPITVKVNGITASSSAAFTPTVVFSGTVKNYSGSNQNGVTVATVGLAPTYSEVSTSTYTDATNGSGYYAITVPAGYPFSLHFSKTTFHDVFTAVMQQTQNNPGSTYTLYTDSNISSDLGITLAAGKGLIGGLRARVSLFEDGTNWVSGAVVTTISKNHGANYYTVAYTGGATSTASDGIFYVLNVDEGDYVAVTASYAGWGFETRTWITHAGAVSENRLRGTPRPVVTPSPAAGTYCSAQSVTLTAGGSSGQACASGCTVFYTTNGNDPTLPGANSSPGSAGPISIPSTTTLKFYAKNGDNISGTVTTANYVISGSTISGSCGSSSGGTFTTAPTTNLCNTGTPPGGVSGTGPWTWTCSGQCGGSDSTLCTANIVTYLLSVDAVGIGSGSVSSSTGGISYSYPAAHTGSATLNYGIAVTLTATANPGSTVTWIGSDCSSTTGGSTASAICTINSMDGAKKVAADFSLTSCGNQPVKIMGTSSYYPSITSGYDVASSGQTVQIQAGDFGEDLRLFNVNPVKMSGGYSCDYLTDTGVTNIHGSMTFKGGAVTIDKVTIK